MGTLAEQLQHHIDAFVHTYNHHRPHRSLDRRTPAAAYSSRPKATPTAASPTPEHRVRRDRIRNGRVSLHGTRIITLITGEIIRTLTLDLTRGYRHRAATRRP